MKRTMQKSKKHPSLQIFWSIARALTTLPTVSGNQKNMLEDN